MLTLVRTAIRALIIGFVIGVLTAPRAGAETRRMLREKFEALVSQIFEIADLPPIQPRRASGGEPAAGGTPPSARRTRRRTEEPDAAGA